jgi:hypothetical protein
MKIGAEVWAAIIIGTFGLLYLVITPYINESNLQISDITWDGKYLDIKLRNTANQVAVIKTVEIDIKKVKINSSPDIFCWRGIDRKNNSMNIEIINHGWGTAYGIQFMDLMAAEELVSHLDIDQKDLLWNGNISSGESINIQYPLKFKLYKNNGSGNNIIYNNKLYSSINYSDEEGSLHNELISSPYIFQACANNDIINYEYFVFLNNLMGSSAQYSTELIPEKAPYSESISVSHELQPNTADRFKILLKTTKSADYLVILHIKYNENDEVIYKPLLIDTIRDNDGSVKENNNNDLSGWSFNIEKKV